MAEWEVGDYLHYGQRTEWSANAANHQRTINVEKLDGSEYPDCDNALTAVRAKYPEWSPLWLNGEKPTYAYTWLYATEAEMTGLHATVKLYYASWFTHDPLKRPPGDVKLHEVGAREGMLHHQDVSGRVYPNGTTPGIIPGAYIGQPSEEGVHGWWPKCYYVVDVILDWAAYRLFMTTGGGLATLKGSLLRVNSADFKVYPAWNRKAAEGIELGKYYASKDGGTFSELLLFDAESRLLENGNVQMIYTIAYDPLRGHRTYWYLRTMNSAKLGAVYDIAHPIASALYQGTLDFYTLPGLGVPPSLLETYAHQVTPPT